MSEIRPMEVHKRFVELMKRRDRADEMLMALLEHPRFRETGDGIFKINEVRIDIHEELCKFVTKARKKYPMCHWLWNRAEFDQYEQPTETDQPNQN